MNNLIDWYAIVDAAGTDADMEQLVTMPAASRLLLMELATALYGRYNRSGLAEPTDMYKYLSIAQNALAREELRLPSGEIVFQCQNGSSFRLDNAGCREFFANGLSIQKGFAQISPVGFDRRLRYPNATAISLLIYALQQTSGVTLELSSRGESVISLAHNQLVENKSVIIYGQDYQGSTQEYDITISSAKSFDDYPKFDFSSDASIQNTAMLYIRKSSGTFSSAYIIKDVYFLDSAGRRIA